MKILSVVGARPNFMKVAPLHNAFLDSNQIESVIVHTGQHYDSKMSDIFFNQLQLPEPHYFLGVGGGSHTQQTAHIMLKFEDVIDKEKPDVVLVVGDVNSTMACAIVAVKRKIKLVHVEAGLRSGDRQMPEEINRILTDSISDELFVTEESGRFNLLQEGVKESRIHFVGNVMIDSVVKYLDQARTLTMSEIVPSRSVSSYVLVTMHRPSNVDNRVGLENIIEILEGICREMDVIFPLHPRTKNNLVKFGLWDKIESLDRLVLLDPQGYLQFLYLMDNATVILTDSGGIQEETTYLKKPCLTFRANTERPVTVDVGSNILMKELDPVKTLQEFQKIRSGVTQKGQIPVLWDGQAATRIKDILIEQHG